MMATAAAATADQIRVPFNPIFRPVNFSRHRYRVLKGSAGSGKSMNVAQDYIIKLSDARYKGANLLVIRKIDESNRDSTLAELTGAIYRIFGPAWPAVWKISQNPMRLRCLTTGAEVIFRGCKDAGQREKIKSISFPRGKLTWIWIEEGTELDESDLDILDDRLRGDLDNLNLYYQITLTFNPINAGHWIKRHFFDYQDSDTLTHHSTYLDNRFCDPAFLRRMERRRLLDPDGYKIYGLGEWGESAGLILTRWKVDDFDPDPLRYDWFYYGQDFGFNHADVVLGVGGKDGNLYICPEVYHTEKSTEEIIPLAAPILDKNWEMFCDSAEPDRIRTWQAAGYKARAVKKEPGSVKAQIDYLKGRSIFVHYSCTQTAKELGAWRWRKDPKSGLYTDQPVEVADDCCAALRYAVEAIRRPASQGWTGSVEF